MAFGAQRREDRNEIGRGGVRERTRERDWKRVSKWKIPMKSFYWVIRYAQPLFHPLIDCSKMPLHIQLHSSITNGIMGWRILHSRSTTSPLQCQRYEVFRVHFWLQEGFLFQGISNATHERLAKWILWNFGLSYFSYPPFNTYFAPFLFLHNTHTHTQLLFSLSFWYNQKR